MGDRPDRCLGGSAHRDELRVGEGFLQVTNQVRRDPVPGEYPLPKRAGPGSPVVQGCQQQLCDSGNGVHRGDVVFGRDLEPGRRSDDRVRGGKNNGTAHAQGSEDVVDRQVEPQVRDGQRTVTTSELETLIDIHDGVDCRTMADLDPLGTSG